MFLILAFFFYTKVSGGVFLKCTDFTNLIMKFGVLLFLFKLDQMKHWFSSI